MNGLSFVFSKRGYSHSVNNVRWYLPPNCYILFFAFSEIFSRARRLFGHLRRWVGWLCQPPRFLGFKVKIEGRIIKMFFFFTASCCLPWCRQLCVKLFEFNVIGWKLPVYHCHCAVFYFVILDGDLTCRFYILLQKLIKIWGGFYKVNHVKYVQFFHLSAAIHMQYARMQCCRWRIP